MRLPQNVIARSHCPAFLAISIRFKADAKALHNHHIIVRRIPTERYRQPARNLFALNARSVKQVFESKKAELVMSRARLFT